METKHSLLFVAAYSCKYFSDFSDLGIHSLLFFHVLPGNFFKNRDNRKISFFPFSIDHSIFKNVHQSPID